MYDSTTRNTESKHGREIIHESNPVKPMFTDTSAALPYKL